MNNDTLLQDIVNELDEAKERVEYLRNERDKMLKWMRMHGVSVTLMSKLTGMLQPNISRIVGGILPNRSEPMPKSLIDRGRKLLEKEKEKEKALTPPVVNEPVIDDLMSSDTIITKPKVITQPVHVFTQLKKDQARNEALQAIKDKELAEQQAIVDSFMDPQED